MEFLIDAIFSQTGEFFGANIASYNSTDIMKRPFTNLYDMKTFLDEVNNMDMMGFEYDNQKKSIVSDTPARCVMVDKVANYVFKDVRATGGKAYNVYKADITDVVLCALAYGMFIVPNYRNDDEELILLPMRNFKVSNSSFNIYCAYQNNNDEFSTFSLLKLEDGSQQEFTLVIPESILSGKEALDNLSSKMTGTNYIRYICNREISGENYYVYLVNCGLIGSPCYIGEAFTSYISYNVALYDTGLKILNQFSNIGEETEKKKSSIGSMNIYREKRIPINNIEIVHEYYRKSHIAQVMKLYGNDKELDKFLNSYPESIVDVTWLDLIINSDTYKSTLKRSKEGCQNENSSVNSDDYVMTALKYAAKSMIVDCKELLLTHSIELLSIRYFLSRSRIMSEPLMHIGGGGIDGFTRVRCS